MYAILCKNGNLVISNYRLNWNVPLLKDYGQVKNGEIPWMYEDKLKIIKITIFDKIKLYDFDRWFVKKLFDKREDLKRKDDNLYIQRHMIQSDLYYSFLSLHLKVKYSHTINFEIPRSDQRNEALLRDCD